MSLEPLNRVLGSLQKQEAWQEQQQFQRLLKCWPKIVGPVVAAQARPVALSQRGLLKVATSSSAWAQNLAFERQRIMEKLNTKLTKPLVDLHFSTRQWQDNWSQQSSGSRQRQQPPSQPLNKLDSTSPSEFTPFQSPATAFECWAKMVQARSRLLPLCPGCKCPTPPGELERWLVCGLCAARQRPPGG
jgi:predicted nucleic acid-binding Zn ribbon protein